MGADAVAKLLPQGGQGILMGGPPNASWARRRVAGFLDGIKKHPNIKVIAVVSSDNAASDGLTKFSNAAQANPKFDFIYVTGSFVLQPQSIPAEYHKAVYVAGSLTPVTLAALKEGSAASILPDFSISVGYIGVSVAVHKLNGDPVPHFNCAPSGAMFKADVNDPVWIGRQHHAVPTRPPLNRPRSAAAARWPRRRPFTMNVSPVSTEVQYDYCRLNPERWLCDCGNHKAFSRRDGARRRGP